MTEWTLHPRCCWCGADFTQDMITDSPVWLCASPVCAQRQMDWAMFDDAGRLFYLPTPKQVELEEAIASQRFGFICAGGSRGGGKSVGWRRIAQRYCRQFDNFSVLFLRREYKQLIRNHIKFAVRETKRLGGKHAGFVSSWPNGSEIEFGHCQDPDDFTNYVGAEVDLLVFDQLELFTDEQFTEISAAAGRIVRPHWRSLVGAGENPGGPLSSFVDELFLAKTRDRVKYPKYNPANYGFIHSQLEDNPHVDPRYVDNLAQMKPERREMFRYGRRDVFPGQYFKHFAAQGRVQKLDVQ